MTPSSSGFSSDIVKTIASVLGIIAPVVTFICLMVRYVLELDGWWDHYTSMYYFAWGAALIFFVAILISLRSAVKNRSMFAVIVPVLSGLSFVAIWLVIISPHDGEMKQSKGNYALVLTKQGQRVSNASIVYTRLEEKVDAFNCRYTGTDCQKSEKGAKPLEEEVDAFDSPSQRQATNMPRIILQTRTIPDPRSDTARKRLATMVNNREFTGAIWFDYNGDDSAKNQINDVTVQRQPQTLPDVYHDPLNVGTAEEIANRMFDMTLAYTGTMMESNYTLDPARSTEDPTPKTVLEIFDRAIKPTQINFKQVAELEPLFYFAWLDAVQRTDELYRLDRAPVGDIIKGLTDVAESGKTGHIENLRASVWRVLAKEYERQGDQVKKREVLDKIQESEIPNLQDRQEVKCMKSGIMSTLCTGAPPRPPLPSAIPPTSTRTPTREPTKSVATATHTPTPTLTPPSVTPVLCPGNTNQTGSIRIQIINYIGGNDPITFRIDDRLSYKITPRGKDPYSCFILMQPGQYPWTGELLWKKSIWGQLDLKYGRVSDPIQFCIINGDFTINCVDPEQLMIR